MSANDDDPMAIVLRDAIVPAYRLLPSWMNTPEATAMILAAGMQESRFKYRVQKIAGQPYVKGPARGYWQFERAGGVRGVMSVRKKEAMTLAFMCDVDWSERAIHEALETDDILAAGMARLLLACDPHPLPALNCESQEAWETYMRCWRPGKPRRDTWDVFHYAATLTCRRAGA